MYTFSDRCIRQTSRMLAKQFYLHGNPRILATLFRRHKDAVFRLCRHYLKNEPEAEDATMEIFEYLPRHLRRYQVEHFLSWLLRFSRNYCLRRLERNRKHRYYYPLIPPQTCWEDSHPEARRQRERLIERLHLAMDQLKREQRECLFGFYYENKSYKEIADSLQLPAKAVKSHIQNGKRNLRKLLSEAE